MDIVEQLRTAPTRLTNVGANAEKMMTAADEIERLRAKITKADYLLTQGAPTLALEALQTP